VRRFEISMKKREIESRLCNVISKSVPDVFNDVLTKCEKKNNFYRKESVMKKEKNRDNKFLVPRLAGVFALMVLCIGGVFGFNRYNKMYKVDSVIDFDVNPSIELSINKSEKVISVNALNEDGKIILDNMDLDKVDLDVAVNAIIGSMVKNGYISDIENSILVSVKNDDIDRANKLKDDITNSINEILSSSSIKGSVLSQTYDDNTENKKLAEDNNVSDGKAKLINNILKSDIKDSKGKAYTFESLSKLSINELNLLLKEKKASVKDTSTSGTASDKGYIGKDKAKSIVFKDAGVSSSKVSALGIELDADDGILVYEVDFRYGNKEYDYEINAKTGKIIDKEVEVDDDYKESTTKPSTNQNTNNNTSNKTNTNSTSTYIGKDKAKSIAFKDSGVDSIKVRDLEVELDKDDGVYVYEVSFEVNNTEYDYKINAKTGKIIDKEIDRDND